MAMHARDSTLGYPGEGPVSSEAEAFTAEQQAWLADCEKEQLVEAINGCGQERTPRPLAAMRSHTPHTTSPLPRYTCGEATAIGYVFFQGELYLGLTSVKAPTGL